MMVKIAIQCIRMKMEKYTRRKKLGVIKDLLEEEIYRLSSDIYFYFINKFEIKERCIVETDDYTENTDLGREIYYLIEDTIFKSMNDPNHNMKDWDLFNNVDIKDRIKSIVSEYDKKRLH